MRCPQCKLDSDSGLIKRYRTVRTHAITRHTRKYEGLNIDRRGYTCGRCKHRWWSVELEELKFDEMRYHVGGRIAWLNEAEDQQVRKTSI